MMCPALSVTSMVFSGIAIWSYFRVKAIGRKQKAEIDKINKIAEQVKSIQYEELSAGPKYREYGDLS